MAVSRDVARVRFARFVQRAIDRARKQGLTDAEISERTGVGPSTFHRWRRGEWGKEGPQLDRVAAFVEGLDLDVSDALSALGLPGSRQDTPPDRLDPDLQIIARRLGDPAVSEAEKATIRATLRYLADLASHAPGPPARKRAAG